MSSVYNDSKCVRVVTYDRLSTNVMKFYYEMPAT